MKKHLNQKLITFLIILFGLNSALFFSQCTGQEAVPDPDPIEEEKEEEEEEQEQEEEGPLMEIAFPGAEGFGKYTTGGRGGRVIKVTNLNDSGPGSLRNAVNAVGARIVVFEVSGNIKLNSALRIRNNDITIAGQTAPGDGICIQDHVVTVDASNVIIRYMRFRLGDLNNVEDDALWGRYQENVIIDHCSMSWSLDECSSFYYNKDFTMQWCILSESLNDSGHNKGIHGYGAIWGGHNATFHHNLLAHHNSRNPRFNGGDRSGMAGSPFLPKLENVDFRNNVIYNWGNNSSYGGENGQYNMVGNYYKPGPGTPSNRARRILEVSVDGTFAPGYGMFHLAGNYMEGATDITEDNWKGVNYRPGSSISTSKAMQPFPYELITEQPAQDAYKKVLDFAGANLVRDVIDSRVIEEVNSGTVTYSGSRTGKKGHIDSQDDVGAWPELKSKEPLKDSSGDGMPDEWKIAMKLDPMKNEANGRDLSPVYDNIEVYINSLVKDLTESQLK